MNSSFVHFLTTDNYSVFVNPALVAAVSERWAIRQGVNCCEGANIFFGDQFVGVSDIASVVISKLNQS